MNFTLLVKLIPLSFFFGVQNQRNYVSFIEYKEFTKTDILTQSFLPR